MLGAPILIFLILIHQDMLFPRDMYPWFHRTRHDVNLKNTVYIKQFTCRAMYVHPSYHSEPTVH